MRNCIEIWCGRLFVAIYACCIIGLINMDLMKKNRKDQVELSSVSQLVQINDVANGYIIAVGKEKIDTAIVDKGDLCRILCKDNYIEQKGNIPLGIFYPIYILEFSCKNYNYHIEYSIANAEVRVLRNGIIEKTVLMYNPDNLVEFFESFF